MNSLKETCTIRLHPTEAREPRVADQASGTREQPRVPVLNSHEGSNLKPLDFFEPQFPSRKMETEYLSHWVIMRIQ